MINATDAEDLLYSSEASASRYLFYQGLNDINIFVEDDGKEYEYETIFKRLLKDKYCITAIFSLGGKPKVKERFEEFGTESKQDNKIKNFYIVDGDFDRYIHSETMIDSPYFIYLHTYNIENYFLDENACIQFVKGRLKCFDGLAKNKINFINWKETIVGQASKLFLCYCFVQKYFPTNETLSRPYCLFIDQKTGFERTDGAYDQYWQYILSLDCDAENKINEIRNKYIEVNGDNYFNLICGKFLFVSLCCYLRSIIKSKFNNSDFRWHLVNHFDVTKLNYIKDTILSQATP